MFTDKLTQCVQNSTMLTDTRLHFVQPRQTFADMLTQCVQNSTTLTDTYWHTIRTEHPASFTQCVQHIQSHWDNSYSTFTFICTAHPTPLTQFIQHIQPHPYNMYSITSVTNTIGTAPSHTHRQTFTQFCTAHPASLTISTTPRHAHTICTAHQAHSHNLYIISNPIHTIYTAPSHTHRHKLTQFVSTPGLTHTIIFTYSTQSHFHAICTAHLAILTDTCLHLFVQHIQPTSLTHAHIQPASNSL